MLTRTLVAVTGLALLAGCGSKGMPQSYGGPPSASATPGQSSTPGPTSGTLTPDPSEDPALATFYEQKVSWRTCGDAQCAKVTVPIDWATPDGATIKLAINRLRATGPGAKIGALLTNPGGPGASGVGFVQQAAAGVGASVRARYDLVGFDPRGVGGSAPIHCLTDRQLDAALAVDPTPDDDADLADVQHEARVFANGCKQNGALLGHMGTVDVARDMDVIRAVVGDDKLHYLGYSYGTYLGAIYAGLFPGHIGRMVLDGVLDPALTNSQIMLGQAQGFQLAYNSFVEDCLAHKPCALGNSADQVTSRLRALLKKLDDKPIKGVGTRKLNEAMATIGLLAGMYAKSRWEYLRASLVAAYLGDGSGLLQLSDDYTRRGPDGHYTDNGNESIYAVNCLDHPGESSPQDIRAQLPALERASPLFGDFIGWGALPCDYWPVQSDVAPGPVNAPGAPPILVLGTTRDPATPFQWSKNLVGELSSGVLLAHDGDGHTAYGHGEDCVDSKVNRYLLTGTTPAVGTQC
ncbi:MAG TPA: alpha/beta hydrolase [Sporichthyaceae bacterium]|nr:alpha/beta hydrolase [Sporichthyaceae bacterium]